MVPAARLEQTLRARSADRLSAVPLHWRPTMECACRLPISRSPRNTPWPCKPNAGASDTRCGGPVASASQA